MHSKTEHDRDVESMIKIRITGFGPKDAQGKIALVADEQNYKFKFRYRPIWSNYRFAIEELNVLGTDSSFRQPKYPVLKVVKRAISISLHRRIFFEGLLSGFAAEILIPENNLKSPPYFDLQTQRIWVSRSAGRHGILLPEYRNQLEYGIRRNEFDECVHILDAKVGLKDNLDRPSSWKKLENAITNLQVDALIGLPKWHLAHTYFSLKGYGLEKDWPSNIFYKSQLEFNGKIVDGPFTLRAPNPISGLEIIPRTDPRPTFFNACKILNVEIRNGINIISGNTLIETSVENNLKSCENVGSKWPALRWSVSDSRLVATPHTLNQTTQIQTASLLPTIDNWHHFIEETCPAAILLMEVEPEFPFLIENSIEPRQREVLDEFGVKSVSTLGPKSHFKVKQLNFTFFNNCRSLALSQTSNMNLNVDIPLMAKVQSKLLNNKFEATICPKYIYVKRQNNLFRRLINKSFLETLINQLGFQICLTENLSLIERRKIFSNARVVILEAGAGLANLYLTQDIDVVILAPRALAKTNEIEAVKELTQNRIHILEGREPKLYEKILHGSDSWSIDIDNLRILLINILKMQHE